MDVAVAVIGLGPRPVVVSGAVMTRAIMHGMVMVDHMVMVIMIIMVIMVVVVIVVVAARLKAANGPTQGDAEHFILLSALDRIGGGLDTEPLHTRGGGDDGKEPRL